MKKDIELFPPVDIPRDIADLLRPLIPYLINFRENISKDRGKTIELEFYFPIGLIQFDAEAMQKHLNDITIEMDYSEPVHSIMDVWADEPCIPRKLRGQRVTCNLKLNEHTRAKKQTRTAEGSEEPTHDSSENSKRKLSFPPQRFA
jgi:hypothetical protein